MRLVVARFFSMVAVAIALFSVGLYAQTGCPAGDECVPVQSTDWCYQSVTCGCSTQVFGAVCPLMNRLGFASYESELNAEIGCFILCDSVASGSIVGPIPPEYLGGGSNGAQPIQRSEEWEVNLITDSQTTETQYLAAGGIRSFYCPANFSFGPVGPDGVLLCIRKRVQCTSPNCQIGHPVIPFSQEKILEISDFSGQDNFGLVRYYDSQSRLPTAPSASLPWGGNWASNWDAHLVFYTDTVIALRPSGQQILFSRSGSLWLAWPGEPTTLSTMAGAPSGGAAWALHLPDNTIEHYGNDGRLLDVQQIDGNIFTLNYTPDGAISSVVDRYGRSITFTWGGVGQYRRVLSVQQPSGIVINYGYDVITGRLEL